MTKIEKILIALVFVAFFTLVVFLWGYNVGLRHERENRAFSETLTEQVDTTTVTEVKEVTAPKETAKTTISEVAVPTPKDTTALPVEQKVYRDSSFTAYVSGVEVPGVEPKLDSIQIRTETKYIDRVVTRTVTEPVKKNHIGIELAGGTDFSRLCYLPLEAVYYHDEKFFSVGVGAGYDFMSKKPVVEAKFKINIFNF